MFDYDFFVIGAGSGGVRASRLAAATGARVAIAEEIRVGGTCVLRGCVPKKMLVIGSHFAQDFADSAGYGWQIEGTSFDWSQLIAAKNKELDRLHGIYLQILQKAGVTVIDGRATVTGPQEVDINGRKITARHILVAVGGWPSMPVIPGIDHAISSNEALDLPSLPKRVAIVGGGYIAVEFAGIFSSFGSDVSLIMRGDKPLRGFDEDVRDMMAVELGKKGIKLLPGHQVSRIDRQTDGSLALRVNDDSLVVDQILFATGRTPNTKGLGLEAVGVALADNGAVKINEFGQTSIPSIHALGDVTDRFALTPVAIAEAHCLVDTLFKQQPRAMAYENIPSAVFSQPPVATVGMTEQRAVEIYGDVDIYLANFKALRHTLTGNSERCLLKLVVRADTQQVVGAHMVGTESPEIMQGIAIALNCGATKQQFDRTVGIHPTVAEEFVTMREVTRKVRQQPTLHAIS